MAIAQHFGQHAKVVVRCKQHLQPMQARQLLRQITQPVAADVEHFQRIGQRKNLVGQFRQAASQIQAAHASQGAAAQLFKGVHGGCAWVSGRQRSDGRWRGLGAADAGDQAWRYVTQTQIVTHGHDSAGFEN